MPNSSVVAETFINASRMGNRRILETLTVRYTDAKIVPKLVERLNEMLKTHSEIDQGTMLNYAALTKFGESSLDILLRAYTIKIQLSEFVTIQQSILLEALNIIRECGADLALPTSTIKIDNSPFSELVEIQK